MSKFIKQIGFLGIITLATLLLTGGIDHPQSPISNLQPPTSNLQPPISNPQSPTSNLQSPTSNLQSPTSNLQPPISNLQPPISNPQSPISNLQSPIPNLQSAGPHKVIVDRQDDDVLHALVANGAQVLAGYESFQLLQAGEDALSALSPEQRARAWVRDDFNRILLTRRPFDTTVGEPAMPPDQRRTDEGDKQLHLVQFVGPIKAEWVAALLASGDIQIVTYVAHNAYVVWADRATLSAVGHMRRARAFMQWEGAYHPYYKLHPDLVPLSGATEATVTVQVVGHAGAGATVDAIRGLAREVVREPYQVLQYINLTVRVPAERLNRIARMADVFAVEPWQPPQRLDERQGQIMAGNLNAAGTRPTGPGYLAWLAGRGFSTAPEDYPIVDVIDDGFDNGSATAPGHPDFYRDGDPANPSRVIYARDLTSDGDPHGIAGHGNLNLAVAGGFNNRSGSPFEDGAGYQLGLGIAPYARLASSKVFRDDGFWGYFGSNASLFASAYAQGARITNHSFGMDNRGDYAADDQEYDALVRDAQPGTSGNQEMVAVVAAGNTGPGASTVGTPANAKNPITAGASESFRMDGTDGCATSNLEANNAQDIVSFSSRGPTTDRRVRPDLVAPGTHVQGAAPQDPAFDGSGVCGGPANDGRWPPDDAYFPEGQTLYTWSSGTSHSAPAVAGGAALVYHYLENRLGHPPSPAMIKAYLANSARYLSGSGAGGDLPSNSQGWGLMDLGRAFDDTPRLWVDQTTVLDATGEEYTLRGTVADPSRPFRVTLAWSDAPGPTVGAAFVNNLDLEVVVNGTRYRGNRFAGAFSTSGGFPDWVNNLEGVVLPAGTAGSFSVTVRASNLPGDGVPNSGDTTDQDFALVVYNAAPPALRAWKDETSFGLENEHLLLHGSQSAGWDWDYLVFKGTGTQWGPLPSGKLQLRAQPGADGAAAFDITAGTDEDVAFILFSATHGKLIYRTLYVVLAKQPFVFMRTWTENGGTTRALADMDVRLVTQVAGDTLNDLYFVPGEGVGRYTGEGGRQCFPAATAPYLVVADESKAEAALLIRLRACPRQSCVYDEPFGSGIGFEDASLFVGPGGVSPACDEVLFLASATLSRMRTGAGDWYTGLRCGDVDFNGVVDVRDVMAVAGRWRTDYQGLWGGPAGGYYNPLYDFDAGGAIDVADIMREVARWERGCE